MATDDIRLAEPRATTQITLPDGRTYEGPAGAPLKDFVAAAYPNPPADSRRAGVR